MDFFILIISSLIFSASITTPKNNVNDVKDMYWFNCQGKINFNSLSFNKSNYLGSEFICNTLNGKNCYLDHEPKEDFPDISVFGVDYFFSVLK